MVSSTRGKSSIVRLPAAALRGAGLRVAAKTTGSLPSLLLPDGTERVLRRLGPPTILEPEDAVILEACSGCWLKHCGSV